MKVQFKHPNTNIKRDAFDQKHFATREVDKHKFFASVHYPFMALARPENFPQTREQMIDLQKADIHILAIRREGKGSIYPMWAHKYALYGMHDAHLRNEYEIGKAELFRADTHNDVDSLEDYMFERTNLYKDMNMYSTFYLKQESREKELDQALMQHKELMEVDFVSYLLNVAQTLYKNMYPDHFEKIIKNIFNDKPVKYIDNASYATFAKIFFPKKHDLYLLKNYVPRKGDLDIYEEFGGEFIYEEDTPFNSIKNAWGSTHNCIFKCMVKNWNVRKIGIEEYFRLIIKRNAQNTFLDIDIDTFEKGYFYSVGQLVMTGRQTRWVMIDEQLVKEYGCGIAGFKGALTIAASTHLTHGDEGLGGVGEMLGILV